MNTNEYCYGVDTDLLSGLRTASLSCLSGLLNRLLFSAFLASASSRRDRGVSWWLWEWPPLWLAGWLSVLVTVLPLASESRELTEPLMWEPLESRELPEGKGSLGAGERQRGMPPRLEHEPVGDSRSLGGWGTEPCSARLPRSTSSPLTDPASEPCATEAQSPRQDRTKNKMRKLTFCYFTVIHFRHNTFPPFFYWICCVFAIWFINFKHHTEFL